MAIVAAEAPESSSHTGKGALVAQQQDGAMPAWFAGFMQMQQQSTQSLSDQLTTLGAGQQRTLEVITDMQVAF